MPIDPRRIDYRNSGVKANGTSFNQFLRNLQTPAGLNDGGGENVSDDVLLSSLGPKKQEIERERRIRSGMTRIDQVMGQFDDKFYNQLRTAQLDNMLPQVRTQFEDARNQLTYALARGGQLNSSVAAQRQAKLARDRDLTLSKVDSAAEQAVKAQRQDVEREREGLTMQLQATADPENIANQASLRADAIKVGQPQADLGMLFQNATAGLAMALRPQYDNYGNSTGGQGPTFGSQRGGSSRVIGG